MWPDYANFGDKTHTASTYTENIEIPLTYFETITGVIYINFNGFITSGQDVPRYVTPSNWPFATKILAAYWTSMDYSFSTPQPYMYYYKDTSRLDNITQESSLIKYMKAVIGEPNFEPLSAIAVTWEGVRPQPSDQFPNETATFQVLLAWDSRVTYAIRSYQQVWQNDSLSPLTYYAATYSQGRGQRPKIVIPGHYTKPEVIRLGTTKPNKDPYNCVQKAIVSLSSLNESIYALPPCPCHMKQVSKDSQFNISAVSSSCYQSIGPQTDSTLVQLCCYNQFGILVNYTKEARVPLSTNSSDRSLQDAYETCCAEGSGLCSWFFTILKRPDCVNNLALLNTDEVLRVKSANSKIVLKVGASTQSSIRSAAFLDRIEPNHTPVTYQITGDFNISNFLTNSISNFTWRVGGENFYQLRSLSYPRQVAVYLTDSANISAADVPQVYLCLCQDSSQCNDASFPLLTYYMSRQQEIVTGPDTFKRGNVNMMLCNCNGKASGRYCENPFDACYDCLIQEKSVCDSNPTDYCPPCPFGYHRDGTQCRAGKDNGAISTAQVSMVIFLALLSSVLPWMLNSQSTTLTPTI